MTLPSGETRPIVPVLLSGGAGVRLWPLSRELYPKQLLPLCSDRSMLQDTALRVSNAGRFAPPLVISEAEISQLIDAVDAVLAAQMAEAGA